MNLHSMTVLRVVATSFLTIQGIAQAPGTPAAALPGPLDLTSKLSKDQLVVLESTDGCKVSIPPTEINKTKEIKIPFNIKRTGYFDLPSGPIPKANPLKINFGEKNPEKGWGLRLAHLDPKDGKLEVVMKIGAFSMSPAKECQPYSDDGKMPEAVKQSDGSYVLTLPKPLVAGTYAFIGFNGASGSGFIGSNGFAGFSKKDGIAWVFEVPATPVVTNSTK